MLDEPAPFHTLQMLSFILMTDNQHIKRQFHRQLINSTLYKFLISLTLVKPHCSQYEANNLILSNQHDVSRKCRTVGFVTGMKDMSSNVNSPPRKILHRAEQVCSRRQIKKVLTSYPTAERQFDDQLPREPADSGTKQKIDGRNPQKDINK